MGANLQIIGFEDRIKTAEQARKNFAERAEQDRHENGHSYSGSYGMLGYLTLVGGVFDSVEAFEKWLEPKGKDDGYLAQIRVIRETKPLTRARNDRHLARLERDAMNGGYRYEGWKRIEIKVTPAMKRRAVAKLEKAEAKYAKLFQEQVAKSTKTRWIAGGWVSE